MRTLIIDNYDSFTYNLAQYTAQVTGTEPTVIRNDHPGWHPRLLDAYDNVILSPGPGTPTRPGDIGICHDVIRHSTRPVLGVCLGHQAIALLHGARITPAPTPHHGRLSPIHHDGTGLFAGLPDPFDAVRYHSLTVADLPEHLQPTAHTPDGVLMGLRHRHRPLWGVQFHPESISTQYGHDVLANFTRLTRQHRARPHPPVRLSTPPTPTPTPDATVSAPRPASAPRPVSATPVRRLEILAREVAVGADSETLYAHLFRSSPYAFWLDSSRQDATNGRYSVMGDASGPLARFVTADVWNHTVTVTDATTSHTHTGDFLDWLDEDLRSLRTRIPPLPFDFALGWVGALGYELKAQCGGQKAHRSEEPDAAMVFTDRALVLDHLTGTGHLLALSEDGDTTDASHWLDTTAARIHHLTAQPPPPPRPVTPALTGIHPRHDRETYIALIEHCQQQIAAGETYEVCLTNMITAPGRLDPWQAYRHLRRAHPAPYAALLTLGPELSVLSTSPERLLRIGPDGTAESRPIKGTRPRGATPADDHAEITDLRTSEKDRAENLMIVDLVRNDLGRNARTGSVSADDIFRIETYASVHQLVSTVTARLRDHTTPVDCLRALFPGGSMTGAPKIRTMELIDRLEQGPRGLYSGALGYLSLNGATDLSITIRTLVATPHYTRYGTGGAITALSNPAHEYQETITKTQPLLTLTHQQFPHRAPHSAHGEPTHPPLNRRRDRLARARRE